MEQPMSDGKFPYKAMMVLFLLGVVCFCLTAVGLILLQGADWLQTAVWMPITIEDVLRHFGISHPYMPGLLGVQKTIDAVLSWSASFGCVLLAGLCGFFWFGVRKELKDMEHKEFQRRQVIERLHQG